jgi:uncharacterized Zn ribbon protein
MSGRCDNCGVVWVKEAGVDIKDYWYEVNGSQLCPQCAKEQNERDFEESLKEEDWGHQPC